MSNYMHKDIQLGKIDNEYLKRNDQSFLRLLDIYDGKTKYVPDDYPVLINCFERLYKGIAQELQKIYINDKTLNMDEAQYKMSHYFSQFANKINNFIPISSSKEGYTKVLEYLQELQQSYTPTRFYIDKDIEEFRKQFRRYEIQMDRLYKGINDIIIKKENEQKDIEDDLELF